MKGLKKKTLGKSQEISKLMTIAVITKYIVSEEGERTYFQGKIINAQKCLFPSSV